MKPSPFFDELRRLDHEPRFARGVVVPYGYSQVAEIAEVQAQYHQVVELTYRFISMSSSMSEREKRLAEISSSEIGELQERLREEMNKSIYSAELSAFGWKF